MTTLTPGPVAEVASVFPKRVDRQLARARRETQGRLRREAAERAAWTHKQAKEEKRKARLLAVRIPLARKGLERILAAARSKPVQEILAAFARLNDDGFNLYQVGRPSGEAWDTDDEYGSGTRDVLIAFYQQRLEVIHGSFAAGQCIVWHLFYNSAFLEDAVTRIEDRKESKTSVEAFLHEIASPDEIDMSVIRHWSQRSCEWSPDAVAFQFFINCARKSNLDAYLVRSLKNLGKEDS